MIRFKCPSCRVSLKVAGRRAGVTVPCPGCKPLLEIPFSEPTQSPSDASVESRGVDVLALPNTRGRSLIRA